MIEDLASANGTFVNGRPVRPKKPLLLNEGDLLQFGLDDEQQQQQQQEHLGTRTSADSVVVCQVLFEMPPPTPGPVDNLGRLASLVRRLSTISLAVEEGRLGGGELERLLGEVESLDRLLQYSLQSPASSNLRTPPLLALWGGSHADTLFYRPSLETALRVIVNRTIYLHRRAMSLYFAFWPLSGPCIISSSANK